MKSLDKLLLDKAAQVALVVKNTPAYTGAVRGPDSITGIGRAPGGGRGSPLQCPCLENSQGQRNLSGYSPWGHTELATTAGPHVRVIPKYFFVNSSSEIVSVSIDML